MEEEEESLPEVPVEDTEMKVESRQTWFITCDDCGRESPESVAGEKEARFFARKGFWVKRNGKTLCGECRGLVK